MRKELKKGDIEYEMFNDYWQIMKQYNIPEDNEWWANELGTKKEWVVNHTGYNFADDKYDNLNGDKLTDAIINEIQNKQSDLKGNMNSQGTTPRRYVDLLGSLMDLTSGSGDKGTPIVLVRNYFKNFSNF